MADHVTVEQLEPCPSGHTKTSRDNNNIYGAWWVKCAHGDCSWRTAGDTEAEAIAAWNTRTQANETMDPDLTRALRSALRFAASRSAITSKQEQGILAALSGDRA